MSKKGSVKSGVAMVEPVGGHSGMDYYDFGLCNGLTQHGVITTLYTCDETESIIEPLFTLRCWYREIYGESHPIFRGIRFFFGSVRSFVHGRLAGKKISHLHIFGIGPLELLNISLAKVCGYQIVITVHDVVSFVSSTTGGTLAKIAYRLVDHIIVHNNISKSELLEQANISEEQVTIIRHGNYIPFVDAPSPKLEAREKLDIPADAKVLLFFGQIKRVKGLDLLLESVAEVTQTHPDVVLVVAGRVWKDNFNQYQEIIRKHNLQSNCKLYIRYIGDSEIKLFYGAADLVVLPYRHIYQSGVLLMAMSMGVPVLTSDIDGMVEVIEHDVNGYTFCSENIDSLSRKLNQIMSNLSHSEKMAENALALMQDEYAWDSIGKKTADLYAELLEP